MTCCLIRLCALGACSRWEYRDIGNALTLAQVLWCRLDAIVIGV